MAMLQGYQSDMISFFMKLKLKVATENAPVKIKAVWLRTGLKCHET